jgi:polyhydroxyalkanoate synthase
MVISNIVSFRIATRTSPLAAVPFAAAQRNCSIARARAAALAGLKAYQEAERPPERALKPAIATAGRATLRDYGGSGPPVVFVPSLINPPFILDLAPGNSLLEWLARLKGFAPCSSTGARRGRRTRNQGVDHRITELLLPLLDTLGEPPLLAGYCLGGTLAVAGALLRPKSRGLVTIAAPWRFRRYGNLALAAICGAMGAAQPACASLGLVPMEVLQAGFWQLDPTRTVAKFERFARAEPGSSQAAAFVALEDWANAGAPLTFAAGAEMFERFFRGDRPGAGRWWVAGTRILPSRLACPAIELLSTTDRIVPAATAAGLPERQSLALGHVGMIVGGRARQMVWEPLRDWFLAAAHTR